MAAISPVGQQERLDEWAARVAVQFDAMGESYDARNLRNLVIWAQDAERRAGHPLRQASPLAIAFRPEDLPSLLSSPIAQFLAEVHLEVTRARQLFPGDRVMTVALAEEFGEVCKAVLDEEPARVRAEAVQLAAMCVRLVLDGDGSVREWRAERGLAPLGAQS